MHFVMLFCFNHHHQRIDFDFDGDTDDLNSTATALEINNSPLVHEHDDSDSAIRPFSDNVLLNPTSDAFVQLTEDIFSTSSSRVSEVMHSQPADNIHSPSYLVRNMK